MSNNSLRWWDEEIPVKVKLTGNFVDIFIKHKPKDMNDEDYVNAIISSWLLNKDEQSNMTALSLGENHEI